MNTNLTAPLTKTINGSVYQGSLGKAHLCEIFNMARGSSEQDVISKLPMVWNYDSTMYVALMFYMRNIRKNAYEIKCKNIVSKILVPNGKGEKLLSYYMALWLLQTNQDTFIANYDRFVKDIGYYKDCLILAQMASDRNFTDAQIYILLMPMASALMEDEHNIVKNYLTNAASDVNTRKISLAAKWAPRQNKKFAKFIPYLKQLCNITGPKSQEKWRKFLRLLSTCNVNSQTIEELLSSKQYDKINFKAVPSKAFNLYKNTFMRTAELTEKYAAFLNRVRSGTASIHVGVAIHPHEIIKQYTSKLAYVDRIVEENSSTEAQWKCFIDNAIYESMSLDRDENIFIPMIDVSGSMFIGDGLPAQVALTLGIIMSLLNGGTFKRKAITFSSSPSMIDIKGDTAFNQINSVTDALATVDGGSKFGTNFAAAFNTLLTYIKQNNITCDEVKNIKIIAFSDMPIYSADNLFEQTTALDAIREKYAVNGYTMPQLIFWNVAGFMKYNTCDLNDNRVSYLEGFEPSVINEFLKTGVLHVAELPIQVVRQFVPLVCGIKFLGNPKNN